MGIINIETLHKDYGEGNRVLTDINLEIKEGEFITLLGKSGCGKTTLLKIINKLIPYNSGRVSVLDKNLDLWDTKDLRRRIGYVIQQIGLFPHMKIIDNITYVLSLLKVDKSTRSKRGEELSEIVGLDPKLLYRYPRELSGGQKQRVGVARALAADPKIILMDEPFGAVDEITRTSLQNQFIDIQKNLNKTIVFVTHDIDEALKLGSRVVLLNNGSIEQIGKPKELVFNPATEYVKSFLGLKGFKAMMDDEKIGETYYRVLSSELETKDIDYIK